MSGPTDRLRQLEKIEQDIINAVRSAGSAFQELSKDKPTAKQVENHTQDFYKTLESVESGLIKQINYLTQVSTGQPHEGSCYGAQKDLQMAYHRIEHVKSRLGELEKMRNDQQMAQRQNVPQRSFSLPEHS